MLSDYIDQSARFAVIEGFGCNCNPAGGGIDLLFFQTWPILLPLISIFVYCRKSLNPCGFILITMGLAKIVYVFYRHNCETNEFLQSHISLNQHRYFRILALACIDLLLTLPLGVVNTTISIQEDIRNPLPGHSFQFYHGWAVVHSHSAPIALSYSEAIGAGTWSRLGLYFGLWTAPILAIIIFAFFGFTSEARATYWRGFRAVGRLFGWTPPAPKSAVLGGIQFNARRIVLIDRCASFSLCRSSMPKMRPFRLNSSFGVSVISRQDPEHGSALCTSCA
jgi:hypothetical protein